MSRTPFHDKKLYGTASVGTKGQVVIPAEAREALGIATGDRLYVVGSASGNLLCLLKEDAFEEIMQNLTAQVESFRALKQEKDKE
jgi:AbrB family looped-hinge helix DNA binding protein